MSFTIKVILRYKKLRSAVMVMPPLHEILKPKLSKLPESVSLLLGKDLMFKND